MNDYRINEGVLGVAKMAQPLLDIHNELSKPLKMPTFRNYQLADYQYEILMKTIKEFEDD